MYPFSEEELEELYGRAVQRDQRLADILLSRHTAAYLCLARIYRRMIRSGMWVSHLVRAQLWMVELRGLEPLTFSLRRHGVDLIRREHGVIDVQVEVGCAGKQTWHMKHPVKARPGLA